MKRTFTKSEAIKFLECNENTRPYRIIEGLEKCGFKNVEKVGRGDKVIYLCEQSDNTDEQCYYLFKDILINEFRYTKNFDYDLCLEIINFHINNEEYVTLEEIANIMEVNVSSSTISRHRAKLSNCISNKPNIVLSTNELDIFDINKNVINKNIVYKFLNKNNEIIYIGKTTDMINRMRLHFYGINKDDWHNEVYKIEYTVLPNISDINIYEIYLISKYIPKYNIKDKIDKTSIIISDNNFVWNEFKLNKNSNHEYKRIYRITKELEDDEEFLEIIKKAIKYKNK